MHNACMTVITIRNVPDDLSATLRHRAADRGQSLQQFLLRELAAIAERSPVEDALRQVLALHIADAPTAVDTAEIVSAIDRAREERTATMLHSDGGD